MYAHVDGTQITVAELPKSIIKKNGQGVSGFHVLPVEEQIAEGWYPLEEEHQIYNDQTHYLADPEFRVEEDKVVRMWTVKQIEEKMEFEMFDSYFLDMEYRLCKLELGV